VPRHGLACFERFACTGTGTRFGHRTLNHPGAAQLGSARRSRAIHADGSVLFSTPAAVHCRDVGPVSPGQLRVPARYDAGHACKRRHGVRPLLG
jgi:hypothetical protein